MNITCKSWGRVRSHVIKLETFEQRCNVLICDMCNGRRHKYLQSSKVTCNVAYPSRVVANTKVSQDSVVSATSHVPFTAWSISATSNKNYIIGYSDGYNYGIMEPQAIANMDDPAGCAFSRRTSDVE
jgi:hypothetical protein